jgi:hypothetical protein
VPKIYSMRKGAQAKDPVPLGAVYVGRRSRYGNPFETNSESLRDWACDAFEYYARQRLEVERDWLWLLRGKDLVCWCQHPSQRRKKRCHAETLMRLVEELYGDEGREDGQGWW